jgi:hypothetical protein
MRTIEIPCVSNDGKGSSVFSKRTIELTGDKNRSLSEQINAVNLRLRNSDSNYSSDYHVAGDPTLLIILSGIVKIELRNGDYQRFSSGEMFIAQDYLEESISFDNQIHGHRAEVIGDSELNVVHLKLEIRNSYEEAV